MPKNKGYILEVLKHNPRPEEKVGLFSHLGYMQVIFKSKVSARDYHDKNNKYSRSINAHGTDTSDWDPDTGLGYTIREHNPNVDLDYPPFRREDEPKIEKRPNGVRIVQYKVI